MLFPLAWACLRTPPNILIWQLKNKDNHKMQKLWLRARRKGRCWPTALLPIRAETLVVIVGKPYDTDNFELFTHLMKKNINKKLLCGHGQNIVVPLGLDGLCRTFGKTGIALYRFVELLHSPWRNRLSYQRSKR